MSVSRETDSFSPGNLFCSTALLISTHLTPPQLQIAMASSTINGLPCRSSSETSQHGGDIRFFIISTSHGFWADLSSPTRIGCSVTHASRHVHAHTGQLKSHIFTITHIFLNLTPILLFIRIFGIIPYIRYKTLLLYSFTNATISQHSTMRDLWPEMTSYLWSSRSVCVVVW